MGFKIGREGKAPEFNEKKTSRYGVQKVVATETPIVKDEVQELTPDVEQSADEQLHAAEIEAPVEAAPEVEAAPAAAKESEKKPKKGGRKPKKQ